MGAATTAGCCRSRGRLPGGCCGRWRSVWHCLWWATPRTQGSHGRRWAAPVPRQVRVTPALSSGAQLHNSQSPAVRRALTWLCMHAEAVVGFSEPCSYGDLPGYWRPEEGHSVGTWTVFYPRCQLEVRAGHCCSAKVGGQLYHHQFAHAGTSAHVILSQCPL